MVRHRAAASSMASGMPSRRRQISATSGRFECRARTTGGPSELGRRRAAPRRGRELVLGGRHGQRRARARSPRRTRPAARGSWPAPARRRPLEERPHRSRRRSTRCSQLSSTSSVWLAARNSRTTASEGAAGRSKTPSVAATAVITCAGSEVGASSTSHTPSAKRSATSAPTCSASRVLPQPPAPTSVTSRSLRQQVARPRRRRRRGRRSSSSTRAGCGAPRPAIGAAGRTPPMPRRSSWNTCSGEARSRRRWVPRSTSPQVGAGADRRRVPQWTPTAAPDRRGRSSESGATVQRRVPCSCRRPAGSRRPCAPRCGSCSGSEVGHGSRSRRSCRSAAVRTASGADGEHRHRRVALPLLRWVALPPRSVTASSISS